MNDQFVTARMSVKTDGQGSLLSVGIPDLRTYNSAEEPLHKIPCREYLTPVCWLDRVPWEKLDAIGTWMTSGIVVLTACCLVYWVITAIIRGAIDLGTR